MLKHWRRNGLLLSLLLTTSSCNWGRQPDYTTSHNIHIYLEDSSSIQTCNFERAIDYMIATLSSELSVDQNKIHNALDDFSVMIHNQPIIMGTKEYAGLCYDTYALVFYEDFIYKTAFFHELMHHVQKKVLNKDGDYAHEDIKLWSLDGKLNGGYKTIEVDHALSCKLIHAGDLYK